MIELRGGPTDCAWTQAIYMGEDSIHALADAEIALRNAGQHERAFRLRLDRKAIGDHNRLFERNCRSRAENVERTVVGQERRGSAGVDRNQLERGLT